MEFVNIVMQRYATKKFSGKRIDEVKLAQIFELIRYAPSAINLQPWRVKVVTDQGVKAQLRSLSWDQEQVTSCSHLLVFCADTDIDGRLTKLSELMRKGGMPEEQLSGFLSFVREYIGRMTPEERIAFVKNNVFIALTHALLGAKALGLDSCPMTGFDPEGYSKVLGLPADLIPTVLCPIGYGADTAPPKMRFPKEEVFL